MENLKENPIFSGMNESNINKILVCFDTVEKKYYEKQEICTYNGYNKDVGILLSGAISLNRIGVDGSLDMLEYLEGNGVFGELFHSADKNSEVLVFCEKDARVLFISQYNLTKRCHSACAHHTIVVENLLAIMSSKVVGLAEKVEILSNRTIREKLLCYFRIQHQKQDKDKFTLPFSLISLANYLCVDRSAMMRELKKMKDEGIIEMRGKEVKFLKVVL